MKTFKTYRNGNDRDEKTKKNANDVHLQCQRIVAFLNLYLHCISVGKIRQCVDASSVRLWGQRVKCVFTLSFTSTTAPVPLANCL